MFKHIQMRQVILICFTVTLFSLLNVSCHQQSRIRNVNKAAIAYFSNASPSEFFAAKEIRRYIYLRTNFLLPIQQISQDLPPINDLIIITTKNQILSQKLFAENLVLKHDISSLQTQEYRLITLYKDGRKLLLIVGADEIAALYGAYRFAELLGVRFYLHGDVIPDEKIAFEIPDINETAKPLFALRGIHPFHDFPEGPDWWNEDDYKAILAQLPKLRMNFFGLHTYPEGWAGPEPLVWIGTEKDIDTNGNVKTAYPSRHMTTMTNQWGYEPIKTGSYCFGAADIFDRDDYGADYMNGVNPWPDAPPEKQVKLFNDVGSLLNKTFTFAKTLGIKTCIGTETPLMIPTAVKKRLEDDDLDPNDPNVVEKLYEGIFARIKRTHPLDYYWFWTPEDWTWGGNSKEQLDKTVSDLQAAINATKTVKAPFTLATCGWVLGPQNNRSLFDKFLPKQMPMSCINRNVGIAEVEPGFAAVKDRPKWSIPWMEDDPALIVPQLWVGRMRRDAADSLAYGCTGLIGIHWRTMILSPNIGALAQAAWDQTPWNPSPGKTPEPSGVAEANSLPRDLPCKDFYADWAKANFGKEVAAPMAEIFTRLDGGQVVFSHYGQDNTNLPRPSTWINGPGGVRKDARPWQQVEKDYKFIKQIEALRNKVKGDGNLERFDYWLNNFHYLRAVSRFACLLTDYDKAMEKVRKTDNPDQKKNLARDTALPIFKQLVAQMENIHLYLLATVHTSGEMGNVCNWQSHLTPMYITEPGKELYQILGQELPADAMPSKLYKGQPRLFVPTIRTSLLKGESLKLKVIATSTAPAEAYLQWRPIAEEEFSRIRLSPVNRFVYTVTIPSEQIEDDFEYYIEFKADKKSLFYPASAPQLNQTVVIMPEN